MYKKTIFLYGGKGLAKSRSHLYNRKAPKHKSHMKSLDNYLLSMVKGVSLHNKMSQHQKKMGGGGRKKSIYGTGLKFVR